MLIFNRFILTIVCVLSIYSCQNPGKELSDVELVYSSEFVSRYLMSCEYDSIGLPVNLSDSTELLDSALCHLNVAIKADSENIILYLKKVGLFYITQQYDSALYLWRNNDVIKTSPILYPEYKEVITNRIHARMAECDGDSATRDTYLKNNISILKKYLVSDETLEQLKCDDKSVMFHNGRAMALIDYFTYLNMTDPQLCERQLKDFSLKYPHQEMLLDFIRSKKGMPLFFPPGI